MESFWTNTRDLVDRRSRLSWADLLPVFAAQFTIAGSIMGTRKDIEDIVRLIAQAGIEPEIGVALSMERAEEGFRAMREGRTYGKTAFTR